MKIAYYLSCFLLFLSLSSCIPFDALIYGAPDKKDLNRFSKNQIKAAKTDCFSFYKDSRDYGRQLKINDWSRDIPFFMTLDSFANLHQMRSLILIQNDSIKYAHYRNDLNEETLHSSYSLAKSFTSVLVGIALNEGHIESVDDLLVKYIPELEYLEYAEELTIQHLLNHTSGIKAKLVTDAQIYYGKNLLKALKGIQFEQPPGTYQHYVNLNSQLLGIVIQRTTEMSVSDYMSEKIWKPIQMCEDAVWLSDKKSNLERTFCCIGATALDYAKFGRLLLNKGNWQGQQIFTEDWYEKSIRRDTTDGSSYNYNYAWHIGLKAYGDFMAIGLYKQHIYICPRKNIIIVALNDKMEALTAERINWWYIFRQIVDQL